MTISELIKQLEVAQEQHGIDLEIILSGSRGADIDDLREIETQGIDVIAGRREGYTNGNDERRVMIW
jgi:hypothetical protein